MNLHIVKRSDNFNKWLSNVDKCTHTHTPSNLNFFCFFLRSFPSFFHCFELWLRFLLKYLQIPCSPLFIGAVPGNLRRNYLLATAPNQEHAMTRISTWINSIFLFINRIYVLPLWAIKLKSLFFRIKSVRHKQIVKKKNLGAARIFCNYEVSCTDSALCATLHR